MRTAPPPTRTRVETAAYSRRSREISAICEINDTLAPVQRPLSTLAIALSCAITGCQAFSREQFERYQSARDVPTAGVTDVQETDVSTPGGECLVRTIPPDAACTLAVFPAIPSTTVDAPSNGRTYMFAVKSMGLAAGSFGNWEVNGFDLDNTCTNTSMPPAQVSCANANIVGDGLNGRDNAFGSGFGIALYIADYFREPIVNSSILAARITFGVKITEWGGLDDSAITVELVTLVQGRPPMGSAELTWDGRDTWDIERTYSTGPGGVGLNRSATAGAACGWMVAKFDGPIRFYVPHRQSIRRFSVRNLRLAGPLVAEQGGTLQLAATTTIVDLTADMDWMGICANDPSLADTRRDLLIGATRGLDILQNLSVNPAVPCNASSLGVRLDLVPVVIGSTTDSALARYEPCPRDGGGP